MVGDTILKAQIHCVGCIPWEIRKQFFLQCKSSLNNGEKTL